MSNFEAFVRSLPDDERETAKTLSRDMSKVVAKSWLPEGEDIRKVLLSKDVESIKQIFEAHGCDFSFYAGYDIEVDYDNFEGNLKDREEVIIVAYPPRPSDFNLSDQDLRDWVNNSSPEITQPGHPYIPVTY